MVEIKPKWSKELYSLLLQPHNIGNGLSMTLAMTMGSSYILRSCIHWDNLRKNTQHGTKVPPATRCDVSSSLWCHFEIFIFSSHQIGGSRPIFPLPSTNSTCTTGGAFRTSTCVISEVEASGQTAKSLRSIRIELILWWEIIATFLGKCNPCLFSDLFGVENSWWLVETQ